MDQTLYQYSPITERPPLRWPDGKLVAFYVGLNIEHFRIDMPATSQTPVTVGLVPDPINYGWRDYGVRVGIWRCIDLLDRLGMRASVNLNSEVCEHYPQIIRAGVERDWAWIGHGKTNSILQTGMEIDEERAFARARRAGSARRSRRRSTRRRCSRSSATRTCWTGAATTSRSR
jgi:hypothetical protein